MCYMLYILHVSRQLIHMKYELEFRQSKGVKQIYNAILVDSQSQN